MELAISANPDISTTPKKETSQQKFNKFLDTYKCLIDTSSMEKA
jgi:hypothetical protein